MVLYFFFVFRLFGIYCAMEYGTLFEGHFFLLLSLLLLLFDKRDLTEVFLNAPLPGYMICWKEFLFT